jgi:hypothetical protein
MVGKDLIANHYSVAKGVAAGHHCSDRVFDVWAVFRVAKAVAHDHNRDFFAGAEVYLAAKILAHHRHRHHRHLSFVAGVCPAAKTLTHHHFLTAFVDSHSEDL